MELSGALARARPASPDGDATATPDAELARDLPEVVDEVATAFALYEQALVDRDLATMAGCFVEGESVVRFGIADRQRGADELASWRAAQDPLPPGRSLFETSVATFGTSFGVVTTCISYPRRPTVGRQSQTWVRFPDGWRIVHAHVSEVVGP